MYLCDASRDKTHIHTHIHTHTHTWTYTHTRTHAHTYTHIPTVLYTIVYPWTAIWTKIPSEGGDTRLHFLSSFLWSCPFLFLYLDHPVVFGDTGIASYFPEGRWVNFRSRSRDHGACRSKCTSAIFGAGRVVADRITARGDGEGGGEGKEDSSVVSQFPQSTRYERFSRQISPLVERVSFTSQRTGLSKMLIKFFITP